MRYLYWRNDISFVRNILELSNNYTEEKDVFVTSRLQERIYSNEEPYNLQYMYGHLAFLEIKVTFLKNYYKRSTIIK